MKKYVWSETTVEGGKPFTGTLAHPPSNDRGVSERGHPRSVASPGAAAPPSSMPMSP